MMTRNEAPEFDIILETDGSTKKTNPGPSSWGFVALGPWNNVIYEDCGLIPQHCTSNEAEYVAVLQALVFARDLGYVKTLEVRSDNRAMVRHLEGQYELTNDNLNDMSALVTSVVPEFDRVSWLWVPRKWNKHADALANAAWEHNKNAAMRRINRSTFDMMPSEHRDWEKGLDHE